MNAKNIVLTISLLGFGSCLLGGPHNPKEQSRKEEFIKEAEKADLSAMQAHLPADPNYQQAEGGSTALSLASSKNTPEHLKVVQFLIEHYPTLKFDITDWAGWTPLMRAVQAGADQIFQLLLAKSNVLAKDGSGRTVLMWACVDSKDMKTIQGKLQILNMILADPRSTMDFINQKDNSGKSALQYAKENSHPEFAAALTAKGAQ